MDFDVGRLQARQILHVSTTSLAMSAISALTPACIKTFRIRVAEACHQRRCSFRSARVASALLELLSSLSVFPKSSALHSTTSGILSSSCGIASACSAGCLLATGSSGISTSGSPYSAGCGNSIAGCGSASSGLKLTRLRGMRKVSSSPVSSTKVSGFIGVLFSIGEPGIALWKTITNVSTGKPSERSLLKYCS